MMSKILEEVKSANAEYVAEFGDKGNLQCLLEDSLRF